MFVISNICLRDEKSNPLLFINGLSGTIYPFSEGVQQIKLNKILNIDYSEDELNLQKSIDKELFLKGCEALYDAGSFCIYGDMAVIDKDEFNK